MSERYAHPILWRKDDPGYRSGIFLANGDPANPDDFWEFQQGNMLGKLTVYDSLEEFFDKLHQSEERRRALGIPTMNYLAFSFDAWGQGKIDNIIKLIEKGRELGYECRAWCNEESAMLVVCFATDDLTEDSGWDIYEWANVHDKCPSDSYGHASWYEFCFFGVPVHDTWKLENRNDRLVAVAPDESKFAFFG
jgi:hypothetical protein